MELVINIDSSSMEYLVEYVMAPRSWVTLRQASRLVGRLPPVELQCVVDPAHTWVAPGLGYRATILDDKYVDVGRVAFDVSPLNDRIYVHEIEIDQRHRRRGYGTAALWQLSQKYRQPITPIHIVGSALGFWAKARSLGPCGLIITEDLRVSEMDGERARWLGASQI